MNQDHDTPLNTAVRLFPLSLELAEEWKVKAEKAEAEVEELQQQKRNCIEIIDDDAKEIAELKAEIERLEEQLTHFDDVHCKCVPRLKAELERAVEIAEKIWSDCSNGSEHTELAALKGEIK
jgi:DNA repair exonuclease SbcCD ATPase subunit